MKGLRSISGAVNFCSCTIAMCSENEEIIGIEIVRALIKLAEQWREAQGCTVVFPWFKFLVIPLCRNYERTSPKSRVLGSFFATAPDVHTKNFDGIFIPFRID